MTRVRAPARRATGALRSLRLTLVQPQAPSAPRASSRAWSPCSVAASPGGHVVARSAPSAVWRPLRALLLCLCFALCCLSTSSAQTTGYPIGQRHEFILQGYVDPLHGDDAQAGLLNPKGRTITGNHVLETHPGFDNPPGTWTGRLVQLPYCFRTLTAAMTYVRDEFCAQHGLRYKIEYPDPDTNPQFKLRRAVIHCLPGVYGPGTDIDPRSGLPFNGEDFPIVVHEDVSIQGTSALDTIFDARHQATSIFQIGPGDVNEPSFQHTFIDGVTVRGARSQENPNPIPLLPGIGIAVRGEGWLMPVISNCFITDNEVGIAIDAYPPRKYPAHGQVALEDRWIHSPIIVNNTIAWNHFGIWSGQLEPWSPAGWDNAGYSRPRIFNNIIDSGDPEGYWNSQTSCFEGLHPSDLIVALAGATQIGLDFNAYEAGRHNRCLIGIPGPISPPLGWTPSTYITRPRHTTLGVQPPPNPTVVYVPRFDILLWTRTQTAQARRALYINELLAQHLSQVGVRDTCSPHDFRLAIHPTNGATPGELTPLVDLGIDLSLGALRFENHLAGYPILSPIITYEPGLKTAGAQANGFDADYAWFHAWDFDCEGYGNWRIVNRADVRDTSLPVTRYSFLDLGADEIGDLIMAGYIDRTRIFSEDVPYTSTGPNPPANTSIYFINRWDSTTDIQYPRPAYTWLEGGYVGGSSPNPTPWWPYVQRLPSSLVPNPAGRYTKGMTNTYRRTILSSPPYDWGGFMASLMCDWTPALLPDIHPYWGLWFPAPDIFASNPYHHHPGPSQIDKDNLFHYYYGSQGLFVQSGHVNPPGTTMLGAGVGGVLLGPLPLDLFGVPWGKPGHYTVASSGIGDAAGVDVPPSSQLAGQRYNCQVLPLSGAQGSSLQSFLIIKAGAGARALQPTLPSLQEVEDSSRRMREQAMKSLGSK